uniref:NHL repeat containing protein n=1 Tax=Solibacter usitatus (strain Ellin6076) TaxID=234267 RepID=Q01U05_SOLUE
MAGASAFAQQYTISTVAGGAPPPTPVAALSTSIGQPRKIALSGGNMYFSSGNSVFKIDGSGTLTLVAGNSRAGFSGDGGPAVNAQLNSPQGVALDSAGNLYIADSQNNRVRKVNPQGIISTFAGNGNVSVPGFWGDSGAATDASIHLPVAIAVDSSNNVYIAASADNTVRRVTTDGIINIFAGAGYKGYYGDAGAAGLAGLTGPQDITFGPKGVLLIADTGNAVIRQVGTDGVISTVSGNAAVGISGDGVALKLAMVSPFGVAVDSAGVIYVAELGSNRIRKIDTAGNITTAIGDGTQGFAGDGGAPNKVEMSLPTSVQVDSSGNLYFADSLNNRIRKLSGGNVNTYAGNGIVARSGDGGAATNAQLNTPLGVAVDAAGNLYVSDTLNNLVRRVDTKGVITTFAGNGTAGFGGDGGAAASAQLNNPQGLAVDSAGNLYIADTQNHRVRKVSGGVMSTVAGSGTSGFAGDGGAATSAQLNAPFSVALDAAGNLYIAEFSNNRIRKVATNGNISTLAGTGVSGYSGDGGPATSAQLNGPQAVAVDGSGNVYVADTANNRVRKIGPTGLITTVAGNGIGGFSGDGGPATSAQVGNPNGLALDSVGNVFITDGSARVRKLFISGIISTIAGGGNRGYSGDGGNAFAAQLNGPSGLAINSTGALFVADALNNAVRMLQISASGISVNAVTNGATNLSGPVAPGEIVVIYGSGLGGALTTFTPNPDGGVPKVAGGTSVFFNGAPAPVLYSSANQVAAVVPYGISGSLAQMYVQYQGASSAPFNVSVATVIPGVFTLNGSGTGQAAAINAKDNSINGVGSPAKAGDYITLYITGVGQTSPAGADGSINVAPLPAPVASVKVTIAGQNATVQFAGGAPGSVAGAIQVNAQIPAGVAGNAVPVVVQVGTSNSQPGVTIAVN